MKWFRECLEELLRRHGGDEAVVADILHVSRRSVNGYRKPDAPTPGIDTADRLLAALGGDFKRAMPGWQPDAALLKKHAAPVRVYGEVSAGGADLREQAVEEDGCIERTLKHSPYYSLTGGELIWLRVSGSSMAPTYPAGSLLACRRPNKPKTELPHGTPVILLAEGGETTFKLFQYHPKKRQVSGVPINQAYDVQFWPADAVEVQLVVLGCLAPHVDIPHRPSISLIARDSAKRK